MAYQAGSLETLKNLVRAGLGVSICPASRSAARARRTWPSIRVKGGLTRELYLIRGKDRDLTRAAQVLLTHVRASVVEHMQLSAPGRATHAGRARAARARWPRAVSAADPSRRARPPGPGPAPGDRPHAASRPARPDQCR